MVAASLAKDAQLKAAGRKSGTFIRGDLVPDGQSGTAQPAAGAAPGQSAGRAGPSAMESIRILELAGLHEQAAKLREIHIKMVTESNFDEGAGDLLKTGANMASNAWRGAKNVGQNFLGGLTGKTAVGTARTPQEIAAAQATTQANRVAAGQKELSAKTLDSMAKNGIGTVNQTSTLAKHANKVGQVIGKNPVKTAAAVGAAGAAAGAAKKYSDSTSSTPVAADAAAPAAAPGIVPAAGTKPNGTPGQRPTMPNDPRRTDASAAPAAATQPTGPRPPAIATQPTGPKPPEAADVRKTDAQMAAKPDYSLGSLAGTPGARLTRPAGSATAPEVKPEVKPEVTPNNDYNPLEFSGDPYAIYQADTQNTSQGAAAIANSVKAGQEKAKADSELDRIKKNAGLRTDAERAVSDGMADVPYNPNAGLTPDDPRWQGPKPAAEPNIMKPYTPAAPPTPASPAAPPTPASPEEIAKMTPASRAGFPDSEEDAPAFDPTWGGTVAPKDTRTTAQKWLPNFLGGKSAPEAANKNATWDNKLQRAVSNTPGAPAASPAPAAAKATKSEPGTWKTDSGVQLRNSTGIPVRQLTDKERSEMMSTGESILQRKHYAITEADLPYLKAALRGRLTSIVNEKMVLGKSSDASSSGSFLQGESKTKKRK
jgi:hypothetical protein